MKIKPQEIVDKQGNRVVIREGKISDSKELQKCVKSYLKSKQIPLTVEVQTSSDSHPFFSS